MTTQEIAAGQTPDPQKSKITRRMIAPLLIFAVIVLLAVAARVGIPNSTGIEREPVETAPAEPAHQ